MSRIYFHSPERTVEVWGVERAYVGGLCGDLLVMAIDPIGRW